LLLFLTAVVTAYRYVNSPEFDKRIRDVVIQRAKEYTGADVSMGGIRWSLREQRLVLEDITLRGTEPPTDPPLAHIQSITTGIHFRSLLQRRVDLFELQIINPEFNIRVDEDGRTNLPGLPKPADALDSRFSVSIDEFKLVGGKALINDRPTKVEFAITNLVSDFRYRADTQVLSTDFSYTGTLTRASQRAIPYTLSSEFDFTRGTISSLNAKIVSGKSNISLQGRIDKALTPDITAKGVEYSASIDNAFLKYFLPDNNLFPSVTTRGKLDWSSGKFSTSGELTTPKVEFEGWTAGPVKSTYVYHYPDQQLSLNKLTAGVFSGSAGGSAVVSMQSGQPHIAFDVDYMHVDSAQLVRAFPWDPKYRIYSSLDGHLRGWFEGNPTRYELAGNSVLLSYSPQPQAGIVSLPVSGTLTFALRPGLTEISSADLRLHETSVRGSGKILGSEPDLSVDVVSSNLSNLDFLYPDANGKGSFKGTVKGPLEKPVLDGVVTVDSYKYREWTIQNAEGTVKLDMQTELADLKEVRATIGESTATVNGTASLSGSSVNLSIRSDHVRAEDFSAITKEITKEKVSGILKGNVVLTSLNPIKVSGRVSAVNLTVRGHTLNTFDGELTYNEPFVEIRDITASESGTDLKAGKLQFNRTTGAVNASADVSSIAFTRLREFGFPETVNGNIQSAHITVTGTQDRPQIQGTATIENLLFHGEAFPMVTLALTTTWPKLHVLVEGTRDLDISADVDLSASGYPFTANVIFRDYSIERIANFSQGTLTASGEATITGELSGQAPFAGKGKIQSLQTTIREYQFHEAKPFAFEFDANRLKLTEGATFSGAYSTLVELKGSIGLTDAPVLDLTVGGNLDLSEVTAAYQAWSVTGLIKVNGQIRGTPSNPSISGTANITNGSLGREGIYTTLSGLSGDLRFNENRITIEKVEGRVGGGTVAFQGTGLIQNSQVEGLSVRIDANQVRLRYPAGLRSSVTGSLLLKGTSTDPALEGSLRLDSLTYRSDFEPFLSLFSPGALDSGGTALDRLQLSVHITGNRNISVQNELADVTSGRVDLDVKGKWANPTLTGHVEATDGTLIFQGKRYEVTRGNIDFVDPVKIEPQVDIQAETDVRDYRVILSITGKGDKIRAEFRSDPPLPQLELVSLIAGGKTRDELQRAQEDDVRNRTGTSNPANDSLPTSEQLFQGGAASILTEQLRSKLGSRLGLMGLDFIRIDPHFESAAGNPALRVTVSQQVNKDLSVTYSQDLASTQQRLVMIEYFISKNMSIVATREETPDAAALGLDIKLRRRF